MHGLALWLLVAGQVDVAPTPEFPRALQTAAVTATVCVWNASRGMRGSGVIIGTRGRFAYVLTARHLAGDGDRLEVAVFSVTSYPKPQRVGAAAVVAATDDLRDLALLRIAAAGQPAALRLCPAAAVPGRGPFKALAVGCGQGKVPAGRLDTVLGNKRVRREKQGKTAMFWEVDGLHARGDSGGGLVDGRGYLIGVLSGTSRGKSYFTHTEEVRQFLRDHGFDRDLSEKGGPPP